MGFIMKVEIGVGSKGLKLFTRRIQLYIILMCASLSCRLKLSDWMRTFSLRSFSQVKLDECSDFIRHHVNLNVMFFSSQWCELSVVTHAVKVCEQRRWGHWKRSLSSLWSSDVGIVLNYSQSPECLTVNWWAVLLLLWWRGSQTQCSCNLCS